MGLFAGGVVHGSWIADRCTLQQPAGGTSLLERPAGTFEDDGAMVCNIFRLPIAITAVAFSVAADAIALHSFSTLKAATVQATTL